MDALKTLFEDIADTIREKTGNSATMKPAEFPAKIAAIETGGTKTLSYKTGSFTATGAQQTVNVDFGDKIPDILWVISRETPTSGYLYYAMGYSNAMFSASDGTLEAPMVYITGPSSMVMNAKEGMETTNSNAYYFVYGGIRSVTKSSFTIGTTGTGAKLLANNDYIWCAIYGIT